MTSITTPLTDKIICDECNNSGTSYYCDGVYGICMTCCCINCKKFDKDCSCQEEKDEFEEHTYDDLKDIISNQKKKIEKLEKENNELKAQIKLYVKCLQD